MDTSISVWYDADSELGCSARQAIEIAAKAGFDAVDVGICDFPMEMQKSGKLEQILLDAAKAAEIFGVKIKQVHLPYWYTSIPLPGDGSFEAFSESFLPLVIGAIEIAGKIGCPLAVLHLIERFDPEATREFNEKYIDALRSVVQRTGVKVAFENTYLTDSQGAVIRGNLETVEQMCHYADYASADGFGLCLDTGHALLAEQDPVEMVHEYGKRLLALHVNDNLGPGRDGDLHMLPGDPRSEERVNWCQFSQALKAIGYQGTYNMEIVRPYTPTEAYYPSAFYSGFYQYAAVIAGHYAKLAGEER